MPAQAASAAKQLLKPPIVPLLTPTMANVGPPGSALVCAEVLEVHWGHETS